MKKGMISRSNAANKKTVVALLCGALLAAIGTGAAYAANQGQTTLDVKMENGITQFSTDGGKTWSEHAPEGVKEHTEADGKYTVSIGTPPAEGETGGLLTKVEDGVTRYSTDGGKTWSEEAPKGLTVETNGKQTFVSGGGHAE